MRAAVRLSVVVFAIAGFTLIDMLFVVGLIGVLASMAIPGMMKARGAAQAASALGTLRLINSAEHPICRRSACRPPARQTPSWPTR